MSLSRLYFQEGLLLPFTTKKAGTPLRRIANATGFLLSGALLIGPTSVLL